MYKILNMFVLEEWIRIVTANRAVSFLRYSGIYPHKTNKISGKIFASSSFPVHPGKRRLCTAVLSNPQQDTEILSKQDKCFIILFYS
jgi:hypothetical protein